jgi:hypothetical protein
MTFRRSRLVLFICIYERYNLGLLQVGIGLGIAPFFGIVKK